MSYLRWLAVNEAPTFGTLLGKVLPIQVAGDHNNPLESHNVIEIKIVDPTEITRRLLVRLGYCRKPSSAPPKPLMTVRPTRSYSSTSYRAATGPQRSMWLSALLVRPLRPA